MYKRQLLDGREANGIIFTTMFKFERGEKPLSERRNIVAVSYTHLDVYKRQQSSGEGDIRKNIVNADLVDCIIAMPTQLFYTTQIPVSLWFISKRKKQAGKTLFIDARKMGVMVSRKLRELADEDIKKIADTYNAYVSGTLEDVKGFCAVVDTEKIAEQDYILTVSYTHLSILENSCPLGTASCWGVPAPNPA